MSMLKIYRYNEYQNRSFDSYIDTTQIESVTKLDSRFVNSQIRMKSGDVINVVDEYELLCKRLGYAVS